MTGHPHIHSASRSAAAFGTRATAMLAATMLMAGASKAQAAAQPVAPCLVATMQGVLGDEATVVSAVVKSTPTAAAPYCRVDGVITTSGPGPNSNRVRFTLAMPQAFARRYYFQGEGGSAGYIPEPPEQLLTQGYAVAGTDAGSPTPGVDWSFAFDRTKAYDYAQRGGHLSALVTQKLVKAYYGMNGLTPRRGDDRQGDAGSDGVSNQRLYRYHSGCSGGGRMGIVAASSHPEDYDGVIAGAPGINVDNPIFFGKIARHLIDHPEAWVSPAQLQALEKALLQRYDASDGAIDGLISDPSKVRVDDDLLANFTPAQRATIRMMTEGMDAFGRRYPGYTLGHPLGWSAFMLGTSAPPWSFTPGHVPPAGFLVFDSTSRGLYGPTYDFTKQFSFANSDDVNGWNAKFEDVFVGSGTSRPENLKRYIAQGGKLLFWHGMSDNAISMFDMLRYYDQLAAQHDGVQATRRFARLFLVPGIQHCGGGIGAQDVPDQALAAITHWVEQGEPPHSMVGHAAPTPPVPAPRSFLLCAYPQQARFLGGLENPKGLDVNDAAHWRCEPPQGR